jgi:hypothetical protein
MEGETARAESLGIELAESMLDAGAEVIVRHRESSP